MNKNKLSKTAVIAMIATVISFVGTFVAIILRVF